MGFLILIKYCLFILTRNNRIVGVTNIPKKLPTTEINMAEASLPPTAFVKITAEDTGGGMQLTVANLGNNIKPYLIAFIITSLMLFVASFTCKKWRFTKKVIKLDT